MTDESASLSGLPTDPAADDPDGSCGEHGSRERRGLSARSCPARRPAHSTGTRSAPGALGATHDQWGCRVIAKEFIIAKTFRSHSENFLRDDKRLRDHGDPAGCPT